MPQATRDDEPENARIVLGLLESVERDGAQSQRKLASDLGIALGLVNAYLKRCVKKGLLKIGQAPARRYAYYLTPYGFAEKSRLTVEYLSSSFSFFRHAREDCSSVLKVAHARGWNRVALAGVSDLAEIATICALEQGIAIVAVIDAKAAIDKFVGMPVVKSIAAVPGGFDALVVTDLQATRESVAAVADQIGAERVLVPALLGIRLNRPAESAA
ncbi:MAG TPA: winged helix-turn-helix transcriptional regulator [Xanthobacteraceae bacterium]|jgi:DNA-binding MarR family transcriptional regulator|nr:winged helix-turn-helix transcriptional regulator [Xanthobacteraceae bacterium]